MPYTFSRRSLLRAIIAALPLSLAGNLPFALGQIQAGIQTDIQAGLKPLSPINPVALAASLHQLEASACGRLGLALLDRQGRPLVTHRAEERFPLCSTSKIFMVAALLHRTESNTALLQNPVLIRQQDLVPYSPIIAPQVGKNLTLDKICAAALQYSDNTAANMIMRQVGGPAGVTAFARSMGDTTFRLDRWEPELNTSLPQDPRDTSSPLAMASSLHALALGTQAPTSTIGRKAVLRPAEQQRLCMWLLGNTTGASRIAAGVPAEWQVGDKTGSGDYGTTNDVAILWLPCQKPPSPCPLGSDKAAKSSGTQQKKAAQQPQQTYTLAVYFTQQEAQAPMRSDIVAQAARLSCGGEGAL